MRRNRSTTLAVAAVFLSIAACSKDEDSKSSSGSGTPAIVEVETSLDRVPADGTSSIDVNVMAGVPPVTIITSRGTFENGQRTIVLAAVPGTVVLTPCDVNGAAACAGPALIRATDDRGGTSGTLVVYFDGSEDCDNRADDNGNGDVDCADVQCPQDMPCSATGMQCGATGQCDQCTGNGGAAEASELSCSDGFDNDCDGLSDCLDSSCNGRSCDLGGGVLGACSGGACVCDKAEENEVTCNDGADQDCDTLVDCADPDCQPVGNGFGKVCDAVGNTCSSRFLAGGSTCSVCPGGQASEISCFDGEDNDCDGRVDCQDDECGNLLCDANGKTCNATTLQCVCGGTEGAGATCADGTDNDCDGLIDCADQDCNAKACGSNGLACSGGACACSGNGGVPEAIEASCGDGEDNDCDGSTDCADPSCRPALGVADGDSCDTASTIGMACNSASVCVCTGNGGAPESAEASCADGFDNDCDGLIDCADPQCDGASCDANGNTCASQICNDCSGNGAAPEVAETSCDDNRDNDCDGRTDCMDDQCANQACNAAIPSQRCLLSGTPQTPSCMDISGQYAVAVAATRTRIPADGAATSDVTATFTKLGAPLANASCTFAPGAPRFAAPLTVTTNAAGQVTKQYTSDAAGGTQTVTVTCTDGVATVAGSIAIEQPLLGIVRLANQEYTVLGARSSGFQEKSTLTFELLDSEGKPYPAGLDVNFSHESQGQSFIGPSNNCTAAFPSVCSADDATDENGRVQVLLTSGRKFAVVSVSATATAGGITSTAVAGNIAVVGAKASGARISLDCKNYNVPALLNHDCLNSHYDGAETIVNCTATFADRHGIVLGVSSQVGFKSEAGGAGPPALTPMYDSTKPPTAQTGLGYALGYIAVNGHALPADVAPFAGEHSLDYDSGCGLTTHNPRDGLSTVIVMAYGEEGFVDLNSNGLHEPAEPFIDLGEPYLDANDNGRWDAGEVFEDTDADLAYDGPNGVWDEDTVIWTQARVVYTGLPIRAVDGPPVTTEFLSRWFDPAALTSVTTPPDPSPIAAFSIPVEQARGYGLYFVDENFNLPTTGTEYDVAARGPIVSGAKYAVDPTRADSLGMSYRLLYCDSEDGSGTCAGGTPDLACTTAPCYVVPDVGGCASGSCNGFGYGNRATVQIECGSDPGGDAVDASVTIEGLRESFSIVGTCN